MLETRPGDVDLELIGLAQLGHIRWGAGDPAAGFALLDEAVAAALGGERSTLDTVVYTCCDMLNACELADDLERAAQWCQVADDFVATYGCPFLYAECRIYSAAFSSPRKAGGPPPSGSWPSGYGSRTGRAPACTPRPWSGLPPCGSVRAGFEDADQLLAQVSEGAAAEAEAALPVAALLLARGDAPAAARYLEYSCAGCSAISRCWRKRSTCSSMLRWTRDG